jgi:hypothetical protein
VKKVSGIRIAQDPRNLRFNIDEIKRTMEKRLIDDAKAGGAAILPLRGPGVNFRGSVAEGQIYDDAADRMYGALLASRNGRRDTAIDDPDFRNGILEAGSAWLNAALKFGFQHETKKQRVRAIEKAVSMFNNLGFAPRTAEEIHLSARIYGIAARERVDVNGKRMLGEGRRA